MTVGVVVGVLAGVIALVAVLVLLSNSGAGHVASWRGILRQPRRGPGRSRDSLLRDDHRPGA